MEISTARCKAQNVLGMMFVSCTTYSFRRALCARFKSFLMRYLVSTPISILPQCTCVCVRQTCRVSVLAGQGHPSQRIRSFPHVPGNFALHVYIPGVHIIFESDPSRLLFSTVTGEQEVILLDAGSECSWRTHVPAHVGSHCINHTGCFIRHS